MRIFTAQYRYSGPDRLDVTVKGQDPVGKAFAPTWEMVKGVKNGFFSEDDYLSRYKPILDRGLASSGGAFENKEKVVLVCFCGPGTFCHRITMAEEMERRGIGVYEGEINLGKAPDWQPGDLLAIERGVVVHQVNAKGVMGAGIALQFRKKHPAMYEAYRNLCSIQTKDGLKLGKIFLWRASDKLIVANFCGQDGLGRSRRQTEYWALRQCLNKLKSWLQLNSELTGKEEQINFPWKMGCSLGGGNWYLVHSMIKNVFPKARIIRKT
jgi:hypothetical protein